MSAPSLEESGLRDEVLARWVGRCLQLGVVAAAAIVVLGGGFYFAAHGRESPSLTVFRGEPAALRAPVTVLQGALAGNPAAVIQLGLLVLVATPVARVALSAVAFARVHDWVYATVSLWVFGVLIYSLLGAT